MCAVAHFERRASRAILALYRRLPIARLFGLAEQATHPLSSVNDAQRNTPVYFTSLELAFTIGIGAVFVLGGLATLALGQNDTATTMLLAGLAVLGIYVWSSRSEW
jgi:hypothetical protein